jgi:hypothetical protein
MRTTRPATHRPATHRGVGRRRRDQRGAVLVEAAFVFPFLILLAMGILEFGSAWRDRLTVQTAVRTATRTGSALGRDVQSDYNILQSLNSALGGVPTSNIDQIIVYRSSTPDGAVPASCVSSGSQSGLCNVYTSAHLSLPSTSFGCGPSALDSWWCPTSRVVSQAAAGGPDYLGVYVRFNRPYLTKLFGTGSITMRDAATFRLEPQ